MHGLKHTKIIHYLFSISKKNSPLLVVCVVLFFCFSIKAQTNSSLFVGAYGDPLHLGSHANIDSTILRLKDLHANTYMWLISGQPNWNDLQSFLPKAKMAGITVWAYLRPPTETPQTGDCCYSEPYDSDYVAWAQAIAKLSLRYSNLVGYVIDDFPYSTPYWYDGRDSLFTPSYINKMVSAGKAINPNLKFYPCQYFEDIDFNFWTHYAPIVDGILAPYPGATSQYVDDSTAILKLATLANPSKYQVFFDTTTLPSVVGNYGFGERNINVINAQDTSIILFCSSNLSPKNYFLGYTSIQVKIDGKIIWSDDLADSARKIATKINLGSALAGKTTAKLSVGLYNSKAMYSANLNTTFGILSMQGIQYSDTSWTKNTLGNFGIYIPTVNLPVIIMEYAQINSGSIFSQLYPNEAATPENIANHIAVATPFLLNKQIQGLVTIGLDLSNSSTVFPFVQQIYQSFWSQWK
jgi:hypothetical protein